MAVQRDKVINNAEKLVAKGKVEAAIKEYERLLDDNPNDVNTLNRIGDLWVRINRNDEAVKVFSRIADHYGRDGFFLKAIAIYKKIQKLDPSKLEVYGKLADLYAKQGLAMEAKSQYQVLADYYVKHGDTANALATYKKISELDPNSINIHVKLADLYSQNSQHADALKEYDRVGKMLLKRGMTEEAVAVYRKALKIDARNIDLAESLVSALLEAKDYDNSIQLLELSLETNRENPRLLALLGRAHIAKGDLATARRVLDRSLAANPNDSAIRETLADVYLKQGASDQAFNLIAPLVDNALARNDGRVAVEMLNRVLRVAPSHIATLEKLVGVYTRLKEETNLLAAMSSLVEAHVSSSHYREAMVVLQDLIKKEPDNAQHKEKLAFVQQQLGAGARGAAAPPPVEAPRPAPPVTVREPEPEEELSLDLDESPPVDLDLSAGAEPESITPPEPEDLVSIDLEEGEGEGESENLDFITEHLTESEVFAKYGLTDKAIEHLQAVLERAPKHPVAHERLLRLYLEETENEKARAIAENYIALLRDAGDTAAIASVESDLSSRGIDLGMPGSVAPEPWSIPETPEIPTIAPIEPAPEEYSFDLNADEGAELEFEIEEGPETAEVETADLTEVPFEDVPAIEQPAIPVEETFEVTLEPAEEEVAFNVDEPAAEEEITFDVGGELPSEEPALDTFVSAAPPAAMERPAVEELGEIDFYIEQELLQEADSKVQALLARYPGDPELVARETRLTSSRKKAKPAVPQAPSRPAVFSAADIENELLAALPDDEEEARPSGPAAVPAPAAHEDESALFADEDDFFDLASELEDELNEEEEASVSLSEEEQSLEEIFREFKKGVEQQLDSEDYDTHYNLGIAYKEMGLIDEAIGEFQLASKDPKRTIECCSMLGLCFLEKGMPQLAIKWYRKGLESPEITDDEHLGLLYDLGTVFLEVGDTENAHKTFLEVYGINSNYRDIANRIKQLEDATR